MEEDRLRGVLGSVGDAIVSADGDSRILSWNAAAERMFGWTEEEALGRSLTDLMPERYREAHLAGIARLRETGEPKLLGGAAVALEARRKDGTEFPIELTLGAWSGDEGDVYTGVLRDISDRRELERQRDAQYRVAAALAASTDLEEAAHGVVRALAEATGWPLGALWMADDDDRVLRCAALWREDGRAVPAFERATRTLTIERGVGLPGRVWESADVVWIDDIASELAAPRVDAAAQEGLHAAIGLPVPGEDRVIGVLEFFSRRTGAPDARHMAMMRTLAEHAGNLLQRRRAEERLVELSAELEQRRASERHAQQINAHVVHHLVNAMQALERGETAAVEREMRETLAQASRIVTELGVAGAPPS